MGTGGRQEEYDELLTTVGGGGTAGGEILRQILQHSHSVGHP